jgi:hypothetical protein
MRNNSETGTARPSKRLGIVPTTLAVLGATFVGQAALSHFDETRQHNARAEAQRTVTDCRDVVRCTLGKISLAYQTKFPGMRSVDSKLTGQTVTLGGTTFKVGFAEKLGNVLIDEDGTQFLATEDLDNTIETVNAVLNSETETK